MSITSWEMRYRLKWELQTLEKLGCEKIFIDFVKLLLDDSQSKETLKQARIRIEKTSASWLAHRIPHMLGLYYLHRATLEELQELEKSGDSIVRYFQRASYHGCAIAETNLGHLRIESLHRDAEQHAKSHYESAAKSEEAAAIFQLGLPIFREEFQGGVSFHNDWTDKYETAAKAGYAFAQFNLGHCYETGKGFEKDIRLAVAYYKQAANQGLANAQASLGICYLKGNGLPKDERAAVELFQQSAMQGCVYGLDNLATCYMFARGVDRDIKRATLLWKKSQTQHAQHHLMVLIRDGHTTSAQQAQESFEHYRQAVTIDNTALIYLAFCYQYGTSFSANLNILKAIEFYKYALHAGHFESCKWELIACYQYLQNEGRIEKERFLAVIQSLEFIANNKDDVNNCLTIREREEALIEIEKDTGKQAPTSYFPYFEACAIKQHTGLPVPIIRNIRALAAIDEVECAKISEPTKLSPVKLTHLGQQESIDFGDDLRQYRGQYSI